jgi:hypothetical protein
VKERPVFTENYHFEVMKAKKKIAKNIRGADSLPTTARL